MKEISRLAYCVIEDIVNADDCLCYLNDVMSDIEEYAEDMEDIDKQKECDIINILEGFSTLLENCADELSAIINQAVDVRGALRDE